MRPLFLSSILALASAASITAQETTSLELSNGAHLKILTTYGAANSTQTFRASLNRASGNSFYRIFRDQNNLAIYGYELVIDRPANDPAFNITLRPAVGLSLAEDGGKPVPTLSSEKKLPTLHSGDHATVEFFDMPGTGAKATDTYELRITPASASNASGGALSLTDLKVYINGMLVQGPPAASVSGRYGMFYVPGRGAYYLALGPVDGTAFVEAGSIDRTRMQFQIDNENFDCVAAQPILTQNDRGSLWVSHDRSYAPSGSWTLPFDSPTSQQPGYFVAASDSFGWWLRQGLRQ